MRVNEAIRASEVRTIDENGNQIGILPIDEALALAEERGLDLVEVAPNANPPVCRIMDYGAYKYHQKKKEKEAKKKQHVISVKEIRVKPKIEKHDLDIKIKKVREFLEEGQRVLITLRFHGREGAHPELGFEVVNNIIEAVSDIGQVEKEPVLNERKIEAVLMPLRNKGNVKKG